MRGSQAGVLGLVVLCLAASLLPLAAQEPAEPPAVEPAEPQPAESAEPPTATPADPLAAAPAVEPHRASEFVPIAPPDAERFPGLVRLSEEYDVWIDRPNKRVVLQSGVCLREGPLELLACIHQWEDDEFMPGRKLRRGTKEYESVLTVNTLAALVHTALLAVGAESGKPAQFNPTYQPATGSTIDVTLYWIDAEGQRQQTQAQNWVRQTQTGKAMEYPWVFAGSGFWVNDETERKEYLAENGNLICVSNFSDALLDLPIASPQANDALLFEAFTERIPPMGTVVTIVLTPRAAVAQQPE